MDEILIEERKYISSKRAAKITGYAKDYIGQLCREGRVPARLVGRSWYVLEAAIQDHRFGSPVEEPVKPVKVSEEPSLQSTWEAPRFEAYSAELLPSINRLAEPQMPGNQEKTPDEPSERLEDSWHAWFNRMAEHTEPIIPATSENIEPEQTPEPEPEGEKEEEEEVNIPIHAIYEPMVQESFPRIAKEEVREEPIREQERQDKPVRQEGRRKNSKVAKRIRLIGASLAVISVIISAIGSGYLDEYIVSSSQARFIAGISIYNK